MLFSLASLIVFTLAIGLVQPITPYCIAKLGERIDFERRWHFEALIPENVTNATCQMRLVPAGNIIRGGALGMLKAAVVGGSGGKSKNRNRRKAENRTFSD